MKFRSVTKMKVVLDLEQAGLRQARLSELDGILNGTRGMSWQQAPPSAVKRPGSGSRSRAMPQKMEPNDGKPKPGTS